MGALTIAQADAEIAGLRYRLREELGPWSLPGSAARVRQLCAMLDQANLRRETAIAEAMKGRYGRG